MSSEPSSPTDGRTRRSERSRQAIVRALLELVGDGKLVPTAQQVAERAGVGIRTVFRHFSDMESLFSAMADELREDVGRLLEAEPAGGSFEERAAGLARRRAEAYEFVAPYQRSTRVQVWHSKFLRRNQSDWGRKLRGNLTEALPELADADTDLVDAIDMALSFTSWDRLRSEQRLSTKRTADAMELSVRALVQYHQRRRS